MDGSKFIGWALDKIPGIAKFLKARGRVNEINKIEKDAANRDDKSDDDRLRRIFKKYDKDVSANS